jgi:hypothetical protein
MEQRRLGPRQRAVLWAAILTGHVVVASLVWRDLRHRSDDEVRGSKKFWRVASVLNSANSLVYLLVGRKRVSTSGSDHESPASR